MTLPSPSGSRLWLGAGAVGALLALLIFAVVSGRSAQLVAALLFAILVIFALTLIDVKTMLVKLPGGGAGGW